MFYRHLFNSNSCVGSAALVEVCTLLSAMHSVECHSSAVYCVGWLQAATKKQKYEKISEKKMSTPVEILCKVLRCFVLFLMSIAD